MGADAHREPPGTGPHREPYAALPDGRVVDRWTFGDPAGTTARVLTLGATLHALHIPDRDGVRDNVVLSAVPVDALLGPGRYFGATVGRYANRIAGARLPLAGKVHRLVPNENGRTVLHGGPDGFDNRVWAARPITEPGRVGVALTLTSPDGDQGFPGELTVTVSYTLDDAGALTIGYLARTDAPTVVNLTNHAYFDLAGEGGAGILDHVLRIEADAYTPVDADLIPLAGPPRPVAGGAFDFTTARRVGARLHEDDPQLRRAGGGYDHNWALRPGLWAQGRPAAVLHDPGSGRLLECLTDQPGLQVYTANGFDGTVAGPGGRVYKEHAGIALETQRFPDSPHRDDFPSTALLPSQLYRSTSVYRFSTVG